MSLPFSQMKHSPGFFPKFQQSGEIEEMHREAYKSQEPLPRLWQSADNPLFLQQRWHNVCKSTEVNTLV